MKTYKILGLLLTYPEGTVYSASDEILDVLRSESILSNKHIEKIAQFLSLQQSTVLMKVQEDYVETFDRGRAHCLHLFEHIHGESRDRGQAMVDLSEAYADKGLHINHNELPDYLPLFLEYLSHCPIVEANNLLGETVNIISMIQTKLETRKSPYAAIFSCLVALSAIKPDKIKVAEALENAPKDPETLEELDAQWKEAAAFSGDPVADCHTCNSTNTKTSTTQNVMLGGVS